MNEVSDLGDPEPEASSDNEVSDKAFIHKLYQMVNDSKLTVIYWSEDGGTIIIDDIERFQREALNKHFNRIKFTSFQRQLNGYGFKKIGRNKANGSWIHTEKKFHRDYPNLAAAIKRKRPTAHATPTQKPPNNVPPPDPISHLPPTPSPSVDDEEHIADYRQEISLLQAQLHEEQEARKALELRLSNVELRQSNTDSRLSTTELRWSATDSRLSTAEKLLTWLRSFFTTSSDAESTAPPGNGGLTDLSENAIFTELELAASNTFHSSSSQAAMPQNGTGGLWPSVAPGNGHLPLTQHSAPPATYLPRTSLPDSAGSYSSTPTYMDSSGLTTQSASAPGRSGIDHPGMHFTPPTHARDSSGHRNNPAVIVPGQHPGSSREPSSLSSWVFNYTSFSSSSDL
ncbi:Heat shock factor protein 2 [Tulasnella sp. 427]|nr:Heat shock factor protein 2 [Tulasnella sp. 427]